MFSIRQISVDPLVEIAIVCLVPFFLLRYSDSRPSRNKRQIMRTLVVVGRAEWPEADRQMAVSEGNLLEYRQQ